MGSRLIRAHGIAFATSSGAMPRTADFGVRGMLARGLNVRAYYRTEETRNLFVSSWDWQLMVDGLSGMTGAGMPCAWESPFSYFLNIPREMDDVVIGPVGRLELHRSFDNWSSFARMRSTVMLNGERWLEVYAKLQALMEGVSPSGFLEL